MSVTAMSNLPRMGRPMPPPSWTPNSKGALRIELRHAVIPLSLGTLALLAFGLHVPIGTLAIAAMVAPVAFIGALILVTRRYPVFEMQFNRLLQRGSTDAMWKLYKDAWLLRTFGPRDRMLSKVGIIHMIDERYREANRVLEQAYDAAPPSRRSDLLGPLARVKFEIGEYDELRVLAEQWRARAPFPGSASLYLAAGALYDTHPDNHRASDLLDEAEPALHGAELVLAKKLRARIAAA